MSDTGTVMWFIGTTIGVLAILAAFVAAGSRAPTHPFRRHRSKWDSGPWP
jgi:hypothetical protein